MLLIRGDNRSSATNERPMTDTRFAQSWKRPEMTHNVPTKWNWVVAYPEKLALGEKTDIGAFTYIQAQHGVDIGEGVQIGSHCSIYSISTISKNGEPLIGKVVIGKGVQIGTHSTIMPGVTIGAGAIIGAHSFVKNDIPAGATAMGVPAKVRQ